MLFRSEIDLRNLHQINGVFWGSSADRFFVYEPDSQTFHTALINDLNSSVILDEIEITGAIQIDKRWIVATSEGLFENRALFSFVPWSIY